jgi:hypothetical protein
MQGGNVRIFAAHPRFRASFAFCRLFALVTKHGRIFHYPSPLCLFFLQRHFEAI